MSVKTCRKLFQLFQLHTSLIINAPLKPPPPKKMTDPHCYFAEKSLNKVTVGISCHLFWKTLPSPTDCYVSGKSIGCKFRCMGDTNNETLLTRWLGHGWYRLRHIAWAFCNYLGPWSVVGVFKYSGVTQYLPVNQFSIFVQMQPGQNVEEGSEMAA